MAFKTERYTFNRFTFSKALEIVLLIKSHFVFGKSHLTRGTSVLKVQFFIFNPFFAYFIYWFYIFPQIFWVKSPIQLLAYSC